MRGINKNNNKLNAIIVDDDEASRKLLTLMLKKFSSIKIIGEAESIAKALDLINTKKPDSVFLDIHINKSNGFDLMEKLSTEAKVIFVSADDAFALRAFELNAFDYLKKPVKQERLAKTVSRLLEQTENKKEVVEMNWQNDNSLAKYKAVDKDLENDYDDSETENESGADTLQEKKILEYDDRLFLSVDGAPRFIKISLIECITAEKDYSYIYLSDGKKFLVLKPMIEWENRLTSKYFVRIHRSTIINLEYIEKIEKWFNSSYQVYLKNIKRSFQISRRYVSKLKERFK